MLKILQNSFKAEESTTVKTAIFYYFFLLFYQNLCGRSVCFFERIPFSTTPLPYYTQPFTPWAKRFNHKEIVHMDN